MTLGRWRAGTGRLHLVDGQDTILIWTVVFPSLPLTPHATSHSTGPSHNQYATEAGNTSTECLLPSAATEGGGPAHPCPPSQAAATSANITALAVLPDSRNHPADGSPVYTRCETKRDVFFCARVPHGRSPCPCRDEDMPTLTIWY